jgi:hypothetical protein
LSCLCILALDLSIGTHPAGASEPPDIPLDNRPLVTIRLRNQADLPLGAIRVAIKIAEKVLHGAGVHAVQWNLSTATEKVSCGDSLFEANYCINVLSNEIEVTVPIASNGLGFVLNHPHDGVGRTAWVLYPRVKAFSRRNWLDPNRLLGYVLAHELGHLLLGSAKHSEHGLMRGAWQSRDLHLAEQGALYFADSEAKTIRAAFRRRAQEKSSWLAMVSFVPR